MLATSVLESNRSPRVWKVQWTLATYFPWSIARALEWMDGWMLSCLFKMCFRLLQIMLVRACDEGDARIVLQLASEHAKPALGGCKTVRLDALPSPRNFLQFKA